MLDFSLVTSYVTNNAINKFREIFENLSKIKPDSEIVINDWGLLSISKQYKFRLVLGRLLTKQKKGQRL